MSAKITARIKELQLLPGNNECTDCGSDDVSWAVINMGFFVCVNCAGAHRHLGVEFSQVRSTELDTDCWDEKLFNEFRIRGNQQAKNKFEKYVPSFFLSPRDCDNPLVRKHWIETKYIKRSFINATHKILMPEPAKIGWLQKCNPKGKWQRRYCILYRDRVVYFKESNQSVPTGNIPLSKAKISLPKRILGQIDPKAPPCQMYKFEIECAKKTYTLAPDGITEMFEWIHAIRRASMFYGDSKHTITSFPQINEQEVNYQDLNGTSIEHEGLLSKQGGSFMTWKQRWCVLSGDTLYYYKGMSAPRPFDSCIGSIPLVHCDVLTADEKIRRSNAFCLLTSERMYFFQASDESERDNWMIGLRKCINCLREKVGHEVDFDTAFK